MKEINPIIICLFENQLFCFNHTNELNGFVNFAYIDVVFFL